MITIPNAVIICYSDDGFIYQSQPEVITWVDLYFFCTVSAARAPVFEEPSAVLSVGESETVPAAERYRRKLN
jgi:hypothetical protein